MFTWLSPNKYRFFPKTDLDADCYFSRVITNTDGIKIKTKEDVPLEASAKGLSFRKDY